MDQLVICGHSFGGMTALQVAKEDSRPQACLGLDSWVWVIHEEMDRKEWFLTIPQCQVLSEGFSDACESVYNYNSIKSIQTMIQNNKHPAKEFAIINEINHFHQCDLLILLPIETFLISGTRWSINPGDLYKLNTQVCMRLLNKIGMNACEPKYIEDFIARYEKRHLEYLTEYTQGQDGPDLINGDDIEAEPLLN